jgi:O-acetyl-ADP-ribose deacetylase (regulator of RNase III)
MISIIEKGNLLESIEKHSLDGLQNAANGKGPLGRGIAGAIKQYGGKEIQDDAYKVCNANDPQPGEAYSTISGKLQDKGVTRIIHAVTMKQPGGRTDYNIIGNAFKAALALARKEGITRLGCTALGTGIGGLDAEKVAEIMFNIADKEEGIDVVFIDINETFINKLKELYL